MLSKRLLPAWLLAKMSGSTDARSFFSNFPTHLSLFFLRYLTMCAKCLSIIILGTLLFLFSWLWDCSFSLLLSGISSLNVILQLSVLGCYQLHANRQLGVKEACVFVPHELRQVSARLGHSRCQHIREGLFYQRWHTVVMYFFRFNCFFYVVFASKFSRPLFVLIAVSLRGELIFPNVWHLKHNPSGFRG